ncbi:hypothetical protein D3C75_1120710 [compost metagenome]
MSADCNAVNGLVAQSEGYLVSDMNGEKVMLCMNSGKYFNLGEIGGRIWELMAQPTTVSNLVSKLVCEYDIGTDICEKQVSLFLRQMESEGLVQVKRG